ncbi:hypothetical protein OEA41_006162 [Lepraria neglecta]|uniref:Uncharacterized protein n=1 Tax=Lepraria neglecta TaxID=209136 RepID=A0AAD9ZAQ1_9LECA|nr:hypothetical protein OEA41_006162 [Lepraria neglecta]
MHQVKDHGYMSPGAIEDVADDWNAADVYANASVVECFMREDRVGCCASNYLEVDESETDSSESSSDGGDEDSDVDPDIELRDSRVEKPEVGQEEATHAEPTKTGNKADDSESVCSPWSETSEEFHDAVEDLDNVLQDNDSLARR